MVQAVWNGTLLAESDDSNRNAAWCYRRPSPLARRIKGRVAFWGGVEIRAVEEEGVASR